MQDYWEWRESDRANAMYYQSLAQFAPRAMLLNGYHYHNAEFAEILQTDFGPKFWVSSPCMKFRMMLNRDERQAMWTINPQAMLAYDTFTHPQCAPHGWLCYNWVLLMSAHAIAEGLLFMLTLGALGLVPALTLWVGHVLTRLIFAQLGTYIGVIFIFPIIPFWLCNFVNTIQVYGESAPAHVSNHCATADHAPPKPVGLSPSWRSPNCCSSTPEWTKTSMPELNSHSVSSWLIMSTVCTLKLYHTYTVTLTRLFVGPRGGYADASPAYRSPHGGDIEVVRNSPSGRGVAGRSNFVEPSQGQDRRAATFSSLLSFF